MEISAIIPVYNREKLIGRAVDSVLDQSLPVKECIVVDDGSHDGTSHILRAYGDRIKVLRQDHSGVARARNTGIRRAQGEWIAFLDSDDAWLPDKIAMAVDYHRHHAQFKLFQTEEIWIRHGRRVNPRYVHRKYSGWIFPESLPLCIVSPSAVVIHRQVFETAGYFDESFMVCEDYDLWLRVAKYFPIGLDERPGIVKYGGHDDQLSRSYPEMDLYRIKAMEKHVADNDLPVEWKKALFDQLVRKWQIWINGSKKRGKNVEREMEKLQHFRKERDQLSRAIQPSDQHHPSNSISGQK